MRRFFVRNLADANLRRFGEIVPGVERYYDNAIRRAREAKVQFEMWLYALEMETGEMENI